MEVSLDCIPCLVNQAVRLAKEHLDSEELQFALINRVLTRLAEFDRKKSAPYIAQGIHRLIREVLDNPDPYKDKKDLFNREMIKLEDEFLAMVDSYRDTLAGAVKLAAAGNIIDFAPGHTITREEVLRIVDRTLSREVDPLLISELKNGLTTAKNLLYLGDNAGEIVFDKVFIRKLKDLYPDIEVNFVTRGGPIINDVTEADAYAVGLDEYARVINNGTDIPGTVLSECKEEFVKTFKDADVVIAKGQGNFESLYGQGNNIYFIFLCKCSLFTGRLGIEQNDMAFIKSS